jgi:hypothetical protein
MPSLIGDDADLGSLGNSYAAARILLSLNDKSETTLLHAIEKLRSDPSDEATQEALRDVLGPPGLAEVLVMCLQRQKVSITPNLELGQKLSYYVDNVDRGGSFKFEFPESILSFGSDVEKVPYIKARLEPFVQAAARLEASKIRQVFEEVAPHLRSQLDVHRSIVGELQMMIDRQGRWLLNLSISNLGTGPVAIFPRECEIRVSGKHIRTFTIGCHLCTRKESWVPIESVAVVPSGTTVEFAAVTNDTQADIEGGDVLRNVFQAGSGTASLTITCLGRDLPLKQRIRSTQLPFRNSAS